MVIACSRRQPLEQKIRSRDSPGGERDRERVLRGLSFPLSPALPREGGRGYSRDFLLPAAQWWRGYSRDFLLPAAQWGRGKRVDQVGFFLSADRRDSHSVVFCIRRSMVISSHCFRSAA